MLIICVYIKTMATVYCACLSVVLVAIRFGWERASHVLKCFVVFYVFFPPGVYVGTLNLIASIPGPSVLTFHLPLLTNVAPKCNRR